MTECSLCDCRSRTEAGLAWPGLSRVGPGREGKDWAGDNNMLRAERDGQRQEQGTGEQEQHNTTHVNPSQIYYSQEQSDQEKLLPLLIYVLLYYRLIYPDIVNG